MGVRNLIKECKKYLFRSLYTKKQGSICSLVFLLVARIRPSSATQSVAELGSHFPPEGRGACTPDAGSGNLRATREYPSAGDFHVFGVIGCDYLIMRISPPSNMYPKDSAIFRDGIFST